MRLDSHTTKGKRRENQDNYWCARLSVDDSELAIICLCDGMGGLNDGSLASDMVVNAVRDYFHKGKFNFSGLLTILEDINKQIYIKGLSGGTLGTTCTILSTYRGQYKIYHIGDSRCYHVTDEGVCKQLTEDHSALEKWRKDGVTIPPEKIKRYRNVLTRAIGVSDNFYLDYLEGTYNRGDRFLVCSDGFWHYFDIGSFKKVDSLGDLPTLMDSFIEKGESDNITGVVLTV